MTPTFQEQVAELRRLAEKATPGPWIDEDADCVVSPVDPFPTVACLSALCLGEEKNIGDAEYIAAANPAVVLELLRRYEIAESGLKEIVAAHDGATSDVACCYLARLAESALAEIRKPMKGEG